MSGNNINTLAMTGTAEAIGDQTAADAATRTLVVPGLAIGFAAATAVAQDIGQDTGHNSGPGNLHTGTATHGFANDGEPTSSRTNHVSIDFPYGPTPVSFDVTTTYVGAHGGGSPLADYSLSGLTVTSLHGLF